MCINFALLTLTPFLVLLQFVYLFVSKMYMFTIKKGRDGRWGSEALFTFHESGSSCVLARVLV